jgi:hypothetical protein
MSSFVTLYSLTSGAGMQQVESVAPAWRKSSRCDNDLCVEVAWRDGGVAVRDNSQPQTHLSFDEASWHDLMREVRGGRFDR